MHKDYFGNTIEVGDTILRPIWARLQKEKVAKITPKAIYIDSFKYIWENGSFSKFPCLKRISVEIYCPTDNFINLTKIRR